MNAEIRQILDFIDRLFISASVKEDRAPMEGYMKNNFDFYGVKSPARKDILREVKSLIKPLSDENVFILVEKLWLLPKRESQYIGLDILAIRKNNWDVSYLSRLEKLIVSKSWWDTVDGLSPNIVGTILSKEESVKFDWIERWNNSNDMWLNRSALIHQLRYKDEVNLGLLFALVETHIDSKEFFINKASGWALRQASKFYPLEIREFIETHPNLSNITKREGTKYL